MSVELIAMARAGEVFLTRDGEGVVRRHERRLPGPDLEISEAAAEEAITRHDLDRVGESFPDFPALGRAVEARIPRVEIDPNMLRLGPTAVRLLLPELRRWTDDSTRRPSIPVVVERLLTDPAVADDAELLRELSALLREVSAEPASAVVMRGPSERQGRMQAYFDEAA